MVERFFHGVSSSSNSLPTAQQPCCSRPITLLSGPPSSGKTSLLFQFAFNTVVSDNVSGSGGLVVFICKRKLLESKPPLLSKGLNSSLNYFERIQMKYLEDEEGIRKYFSAFHLHERIPVAVIVDDFGEFFDERKCIEKYGNSRGRDLAMVRVLALCCNTIMYANDKATCQLLLSDTHHGDTPRMLYIYKRWVSSIFIVKGDGMGSFLLIETKDSENGKYKEVRIAKYSTMFHYLCLDKIVDHEGN